MNTKTPFFQQLLSSFGPGLITAALVLGPGTITVCSNVGATTGYSMLWVVVISCLFMICMTRVAAKMGCVSPLSLLTNVENNYGRVVSVLVGLSVCFSCSGFQTGNTVGVGISMMELFGGNIPIWTILFLAVTLVFIWTSNNFYSLLEKTMIFLILIMVVAFVGNMFFIEIDGGDLLKGLIPTAPSNKALWIAVASTSFSVAGAAGQAYMVQGKNWKVEDLKKGLRDATVGILILSTLGIIIIITSAAILHPQGITIKNAVDMGLQLEPFLGSFGKWLFLIGLFATSLSSYVSNAALGGMFLCEALHLGKSINDRWVKVFASGILVFGTIIAIIFGSNPIQLIVFAQSMTIFGAPIVAVVILLLSNNKKMMGQYRNSLPLNIILGIATAWAIYISINQLIALIR
ncbi:Mn2+/Fe2+ NRAMP family transporter [Dysgonomonas hofstadii]|uniref:Mn2+/Fe2+ NRAMP family transporter n=1 Tax=Dysgonomonas hofstadii TaxID=637886 RepID=A0A840CQV7_9BACT|nr:Nramp family divalent metal transporter [Dysgonomonas hofstadii]MBB4034942.1 Mn2+/Fe2+ NRAMP family transporter [Dysgonomonas hofstadii]